MGGEYVLGGGGHLSAAVDGTSSSLQQDAPGGGTLTPCSRTEMGSVDLVVVVLQLILDKPNIQRMLLDELPMMRAFDGFKELADNKDASDEVVGGWWVAGLPPAAPSRSLFYFTIALPSLPAYATASQADVEEELLRLH